MKQKLFSMLLLGVFLASVSLFTSCKDYDDDISANRDAIAALRVQMSDVKSALENDLNTQKSTYETQIAALEAQLKSAMDNKADKSVVDELQASLKQMKEDYEAKMSVLEAQYEAANEALKRLDEKADQATVNGVIADLAALTGKLEDETKAREAVEANLLIQMNALQDFMQKYDDANLQGQIDELKKAIGEIETNVEINVMKSQMQELQQMIANVNVNLDALNVLIERMLNSIALVPYLYIDGIEAIEFTSLKYKEWNNIDLDYPSITGGTNLISNEETDATYRLNPSTVQRDGINEKGIDFVTYKAETRAGRPVEPSVVSFAGIKEFKNGYMTVRLRKNTTQSLNLSNNEIYIVSLKVPRNADSYEAADVYSENTRLAEKDYTPRIASLPFYVDGRTYTSTEYGQTITRPHHYSPKYNVGTTEVGIYETRVDNTPLDVVSKIINYNDKFDLNSIVTGCKLDGGYNGTCVQEITKDKLKEYGIVLRYDIPSPAYTQDVDHKTNQQEFAVVTQNGIVSSKTPAGVTDNKAVVGKEPIIRVQMVDTVHNKVADVRYLKIKWADVTEGPEKPDVQLADKNSETVLSCNSAIAEFTWREFVNEIYAKLEDATGMSQSDFEKIYGSSPEITLSFATNWSPASDTSAPASGTISYTSQPSAFPVWESTTNEHGDALIGKWTLAPEDIETVYCNSANDTKTFTAKIFFRSPNKKLHSNVWFNWNFTIKLPKLPSINGFYDQYWLDGKVGEEHDILPVQFNTQGQRDMVARGINYCVFNNNLMNAFTYNIVGGMKQFIVKDVPTCGTWDLQFRYEQTLNGYRPNYTTSSPGAWKSKGQWTNINSEVWNNFVAYQFMRIPNPSGKVLQLEWDDDHVSWCNNPQHKTCNLYADHIDWTLPVAPEQNLQKVAYDEILNPLANTDFVGKDGTVAPDRTHEKPLNFTVWAALNNWNYIPVLNYKAYMVAPLRINFAPNEAEWQDGEVSGSPVRWYDMFSCTDFRGYLVANKPDGTYSGEQKAWTQSLWNYYEVQNPSFDVQNALFAFETVNGDVKINNNIKVEDGQGMTSQQLYDYTNGNIQISFEYQPNGNYIYFWNNGGSNIESKVKVSIPVDLKYGFGYIKTRIVGWVYPHGWKN